MSFLQELHHRGMVQDVSDEAALFSYLEEKPRRAYIGFDPTSASLTVGNLLPIMTLRLFQQSGHQPVVLCGGGTGLIGDPSGKSLERPLLTEENVAANVESQKSIFAKFLDFDGPNSAILVNNFDWLGQLGYLQALRDIGKHMSLFSMVGKESVRSRQDSGIGMSYAEFSYQLLQSYDFAHLHARHDVGIQMGGSDQWGNISSGLELIRRMKLSNQPAFGVTSPLLTDKDGNKIGKSELGAIWLSPERTSPYMLYQYYMTLSDESAAALLPRVAGLSLADTADLLTEFERNPADRAAQRSMAAAIVGLLYGETVSADCGVAARIMFGGNVRDLSESELDVAFAHVPKAVSESSMFDTGPIDVVDLLVLTPLASSKSDARRLIQGGGISVNGSSVSDGARVARSDLLHGRDLLLRRGARNWALVRYE